MGTPSGAAWKAECKIGDRRVDVSSHIARLEWKSMINGGYIIRVKIEDPYFQILDTVIEDSGALLETGRQSDKLTLVEFKLQWMSDPVFETKTMIALVSDLHASGRTSMSGSFEFIAVDPISYYINSGDCSGTAYNGKIGGSTGVISQVLKDYIPPSIGGFTTKFEVGETNDEKSTYWMMRQDPKTFISSLLDWSSPFTKHKTSWIVANGQDSQEKIISINVQESYTPSLKYPVGIPGDGGPFVLTYGAGGGPPEILKWEILADNFISALNVKLLTSGMSALSGQYFDKILDEKEKIVYVKDENTANKVSSQINKRQGFTKPKTDVGTISGTGRLRPPTKRGWTHIMPIPEAYSGGEIGHKYEKYIDGRARQKYMEMLNMLMRLRVTARGQPRLYDSTELGRSKVTIRWLKPDDGGGSKPRFLDGDWLLYGWHHILSNRGWDTDLYLARLDWDAKAIG